MPVLIATGALIALILLTTFGQRQSPEKVTPSVAAEGRPHEGLSSVQRAEMLYQANCQSCQGDRSGAGTVLGAPPHNETGQTWHHPDAQLKDWVLRGKPGFGGSWNMPAFGDRLSGDDVIAVLSYIKTWWGEEQRGSQADTSRRYGEALEKQKKGQ